MLFGPRKEGVAARRLLYTNIYIRFVMYNYLYNTTYCSAAQSISHSNNHDTLGTNYIKDPKIITRLVSSKAAVSC